MGSCLPARVPKPCGHHWVPVPRILGSSCHCCSFPPTTATVPTPASPPGLAWSILGTFTNPPPCTCPNYGGDLHPLGAGRVQPMPASPDFQAGIISREGDGGAAAGEVWGWRLGAERAPWQASIPPPAGGAGGNASEEKNAPAAAGLALLKPLVNKAT